MQEKAKMTKEIRLMHQNWKMGFKAGVASEKAKLKAGGSKSFPAENL